MAGDLSGITVLVTRPAPQGEALCRLITALGGQAIAFPAMVIQPVEDLGELRQRLGPMERYDIVFFVSRNAVQHGLALVPQTARLAAIGPSTARALQEAGRTVAIRPASGYTSESLLAEPELQALEGKEVLVVRGLGGRELLADNLRARGARVRYAEVYARRLPAHDAGSLVARWRRQGIDVVTATSVETLDNLASMLGAAGADLLGGALLVTASERVVKRAAAMGVRRRPLLAAGPDDQAIVQAIVAWRDGR